MGEVTQNAASLSPKVQQVLELVSGMTLLESAELVKAFEQKFGVSAAPVAAAAAARGSQADDGAGDGDAFHGDNRGGLLRAIRPRRCRACSPPYRA